MTPMGSHLSRELQAGRWRACAGLLEHVVEVVGDAGGRELVHQLGHAAFDPVEGGHAYCPPTTGDAGVSGSVSIAARISAQRSMVSGLGGPDRDPEGRRHVGQRHPEVVVQDDDRALLGSEAPERQVEQIAIGDERLHVGHRRSVERRAARPRSAVALDVAGRRYRSERRDCGARLRSDPDREASEGSARLGESILDRVSRELVVPEDQAGRRVQPRDEHAGKHGEGVMIASLRSLDELSLVHGPPFVTARRSCRARSVCRRGR